MSSARVPPLPSHPAARRARTTTNSAVSFHCAISASPTRLSICATVSPRAASPAPVAAPRDDMGVGHVTNLASIPECISVALLLPLSSFVAAMSTVGIRMATPEGRANQTTVLTAEARDAAKIDARRARAADRVDRFMDARTRTMGVDAGAIEAQIAEKAARAAAAREAELAEANEAARLSRTVAQYEEAMAADRAAKKAAHVAELARQAAVKPPRARLSDDAPPRASVDDTAPASSLQKFDGEDPRGPERAALQVCGTARGGGGRA